MLEIVCLSAKCLAINLFVYTSRAQQVVSVLESMRTVVMKEDVAMKMLCDLLEKSKHMIFAFATTTSDSNLSIDFVTRHLLQKK